MVWQVPANWSKLNYVCTDTDFYSNPKKKVPGLHGILYQPTMSSPPTPSGLTVFVSGCMGETAATTSQLGLNTCSVCTWESAGIKKKNKKERKKILFYLILLIMQQQCMTTKITTNEWVWAKWLSFNCCHPAMTLLLHESRGEAPSQQVQTSSYNMCTKGTCQSLSAKVNNRFVEPSGV